MFYAGEVFFPLKITTVDLCTIVESMYLFVCLFSISKLIPMMIWIVLMLFMSSLYLEEIHCISGP